MVSLVENRTGTNTLINVLPAAVVGQAGQGPDSAAQGGTALFPLSNDLSSLLIEISFHLLSSKVALGIAKSSPFSLDHGHKQCPQ